MTKKWLCLLLMLALLPLFSITALAADADAVEIWDAEGLRAMASSTDTPLPKRVDTSIS